MHTPDYAAPAQAEEGIEDYDDEQVYLDADEISLAAREIVWSAGPQEIYDDGADWPPEHLVRIKDSWNYRHLTEAECRLVLAEANRQADRVSALLGLTRLGRAVDDPIHTALAKDAERAATMPDQAGSSEGLPS